MAAAAALVIGSTAGSRLLSVGYRTPTAMVPNRSPKDNAPSAGGSIGGVAVGPRADKDGQNALPPEGFAPPFIENPSPPSDMEVDNGNDVGPGRSGDGFNPEVGPVEPAQPEWTPPTGESDPALPQDDDLESDGQQFQAETVFFGIDDAIVIALTATALAAAMALIISEFGWAWVLNNKDKLPSLLLERIPGFLSVSVTTIATWLAKFFADNKPPEVNGGRPPYEGEGDQPPERPESVPEDWVVRRTDNDKGWVWQRPGAEKNSESFRVMEPNSDYPNGYIRIYNEHNQPIDLNNKPTGDPETHIPLRPDGTYDLPKGWGR